MDDNGNIMGSNLVSALESGSRVSGVSPLVTGVIVHLPFGSTILQLQIYVYRWPVPPDPFRRWLRHSSLTICSCHQQVHATLPDHNQHPSNNFWLVVEPYPSEKYMSSSVGMMTFPTEWNVIKFHGSKPPTR